MDNKSQGRNKWLADVFDNLGETFERFNPAAFRFLAAFLPYLTPYPVAWLTMSSARQFLSFDPVVAFIFVFALEGMGLWFTSLLVDSIIDVIRSRNAKTFLLVLLFTFVVTAYVVILVNLNVTLKASTGESNPALEQVILLLCFLPLLSGVGNGYYKWKLEQGIKDRENQERRDAREDSIRKEQNDLKLKRAMIKNGMNPLQSVTQYQSQVETPIQRDKSKKKDDWRLLTSEERHEVRYVLSVDEVMKKYGVSRATVYNWKSKNEV